MHILTRGLLLILIFQCASYSCISAGNLNHPGDCVTEAIKRIRDLPELEYLYTLDGQNVALKEIFYSCLSNWPYCCLYEKFYYWKNEVKNVISNSSTGPVKHPIRVYYNCYSICHPDRYDSNKTHGDVAEFYDEKGRFMGLAVYMGNGKYCSLPYSGYHR